MNKQSESKLADQILQFDRHVRSREYDAATALLQKMLFTIEATRDGFGGLLASGPKTEKEATVLASAITTLLADPEFKLNKKTFSFLTHQKRALVQIFEVSGYRGTGHLLDAIGRRDEKGSYEFKGFEISKLFVGLSINAMSKPLLQLLLKQTPGLSWPVSIGFLSEQMLWNREAEECRTILLKSGKIWKDLQPSLESVRNLGPAYMGCSYADASYKHQIKHTMNRLARGYLAQRGVGDIEEAKERRGIKRRPTLVVFAELYDSKHAMHRCYGPSIASLRSRFKTVYFSPNGKCDDAVAEMFDKVDSTPFDVKKPEVFIEKIKSHRPDMVYFPSVGMRVSTILASNVRMAPIQLMTFGHPATTLSDQMDYAILDGEQVGDPATVNETILCRKSVPRFEMRHDADDIKPVINPKPPIVRVAVPAWSRKVTPGFLQMCKRIDEQTKQKVEFWFFPNGAGPLYQAFKRRVEDMLPAKVFPRTDYNRYIQWLNQCDIFFSTVPFGATNGIVDSMRQGLPIINMRGPEVHAETDSHLVSRFDQPDWLTTKTPAEFIAAAKRLIEDHELRVSISEGILDCNPDQRLLADADSENLGFVEVFEAAYRHHEKIQQADKKMWSFEEVCGLLEEDSKQ